MITRHAHFVWMAILLAALPSFALTHYVDVNSTNPVAPYTNWTTAANVIQDAVDAATSGDTVLVTNGVYAAGGRAVHPTMTNRVAVTKPLTLLSVNGPKVTFVEGYRVPNTTNGHGAIRCVYLTNGASLIGFTLTGGATLSYSPGSQNSDGGGAYCVSTDALLSNCIIVGNSAGSAGGGVIRGTLHDCVVSNNFAAFGGGAFLSSMVRCWITDNSATNNAGIGGSYLTNCVVARNSAIRRYGGGSVSWLVNCTIVGNTAGERNGGTFQAFVRNSILYYNSAPQNPNWGGGDTFSHSCTMPHSPGATGNLTNAPLFVDTNGWSDLRLQPNSPCINAGTNSYITSTTDIDGNPRIVNGSADMGAFELQPPPLAVTRYVDVNSTNPVPPYTNWATAANVIQDAVDAAGPGDTVVVTDGVYDAGGRAVYGLMTNRVAVTKPLTLQSVNGPQFTIIQGYQVPGTTNGDGAIRCMYLTNGTSLSGFTLSKGATRIAGDFERERSGGGLWCKGDSVILSNCIVVGNTAAGSGGGTYGGTLNDCTVSSNTAVFSGAGSAHGILNHCMLTGNSAVGQYGSGGGSYNSIVNSSLLSGNSAALNGGGAFEGTLNNCIVVGNSAWRDGGGTRSSTLINCTVVGNSTVVGFGGGALQGTVNNCILLFNTAPAGANHSGGGRSGIILNNSCTTPLPLSGIGNITNNPLFVNTNGWSDLRLQSNSPCINAGNNAYVTSTNDLDGNLRIVGGTVDMGAYEFQSPQSMLSYAWLQQYGLPTDGSADYAHSDTDSHNNWQEWKAWTDPTNELSLLRMLSPEPGTNGTVVRWESIAGHSYMLERATNANAQFSLLQGNIVGEAGTTSFTDTNVVGSGSHYYRVGVPE